MGQYSLFRASLKLSRLILKSKKHASTPKRSIWTKEGLLKILVWLWINQKNYIITNSYTNQPLFDTIVNSFEYGKQIIKPGLEKFPRILHPKVGFLSNAAKYGKGTFRIDDCTGFG